MKKITSQLRGGDYNKSVIDERYGVAKKYYWILVIFIITYVATIFIFQPDSTVLARYHITATQLRFLSLTIVIPAVAIWFAAFYSIVNVSKYYQKISDSPDGAGFRYLRFGLIILGLSLPLNSIISRLLSYGVQQHAVNQAVSTIITTHLSVLASLFGFYYLYRGSLLLIRTIKNARPSKMQLYSVAAVLVIIGSLYIGSTFLNPSREVAVAPQTIATYAMPDWLIVTTIDIPYILVWGYGFYTTLLLYTYHRRVGGKIYRVALSRLNLGFFVVIIASIILQFLTAATTSISGWGLGAVLILLYVLLAVIAVGYVLIAFGAKGLAKLEEVT